MFICVLTVFVFLFYYFDRSGIDENKCAEAISTYELPNGDLLSRCEALIDAKVGVHSYRRLLPANYADGLSKVCILQFRVSFFFLLVLIMA